MVINPATGDKFRRWGLQQFAELVTLLTKQLRMSSVLIGSEKDRELCEAIVSRSGEGSQSISLAGQTDLKSLAALLSMATVHVSGDTGSLHIAAALGKPVVGLYGPTDPTFAGPFGQLDHCFSGHSDCFSNCMKGRCSQMLNIGTDEVAPCMISTNTTQVIQLIDRLING